MLRTCFLMLAVVSLVGCERKGGGTASGTPLPSSTGSTQPLDYPPEPWQNSQPVEADLQRFLAIVDKAWGIDEDNRARLEKLMSLEEKNKASEMETLLKLRPPVELTSEQVRFRKSHESVIPLRAFIEHEMALANVRGANRLAESLRLNLKDGMNFRTLFASEGNKTWKQIRRAIESAIAGGISSLSETDRKLLADEGFMPFLKNLES